MRPTAHHPVPTTSDAASSDGIRSGSGCPERGDEGVAKLKELTGGPGAHSVVEAVGTQESFMQAVGGVAAEDTWVTSRSTTT